MSAAIDATQPGVHPKRMAITGQALLDNPLLNKGSAFTEAERRELGLLGLLPPHVSTLDEQLARAYENFRRAGTEIERYIFMGALHDRNETLFYRLAQDHIDEMMPVIYTPGVGAGCQQYSHIYRRPRGLYVSYPLRQDIDAMLANAPTTNPQVIVVTDGERILGLGDLGVGGMGIPVGKLALYTLCAGVDPARTLPIVLDVGTNNQMLLEDELYLGWRHPRVTGTEYDEFVDRFVTAVIHRFPRVLLQWEDFSKHNAARLLERYRNRLCTFNDDIQGTGAVTLAGLWSAMTVTGGRLRDQQVVILGAGSVVRNVPVSVLIGVSAQPGAFTEPIVRALAAHSARPIVLPLSNPTSKSEAVPADLMSWTDGRALVATGSPFSGVGQCNNAFIFQGVGLGIVASGAERVSDGMFVAAARALSTWSPARRDPAGMLYPPLSEVRNVSRQVALAVAMEARHESLAPPTPVTELKRRIDRQMWRPNYVPYVTA